MTNSRSIELIAGLTKTLTAAMQEGFPGWSRAFLRFNASDNHHGSMGSYVTEKGVFLFDAMKLEPLFKELNGLGSELRSVLPWDRRFCVFILSVNADLSYKIDFEFYNPDRWEITKMNGGTGIPEGY
jgi:hypothetical protein